MEKSEENEKISQEQLYDMLLGREMAWQEIIYDLIASKQLDPWDIDIAALATSYLEKLQQLEEANFFISSKVLLAAAILLRLKSELLISNYIRSLDEILFGKPEESKKGFFRPEIGVLPELLPKTPLPRLRKVTLNELMAALDRAIITESRRIKREIATKHVAHDIAAILPVFRININQKIKEIYEKIKQFFARGEQQLTFSTLAGNDRAEKVATFVPLLHLDTQEKISLEQKKQFEEIYISLK